MTLVDTSVWIDRFRRWNVGLCAPLEAGEAVTHPFVIGELACSTFRNRTEVLALMDSLPKVVQRDGCGRPRLD